VIHGSIHGEDDHMLLATVSRAATAWERMKGLLGSAPLQANEGLLIDPCASIHTFFMRYPIDLVYLDRQYVIQKLVRQIRPWRMSACPSANMALELAAGQIDKLELKIDMQLIWNENE